jgi:hypothetical protein
MADLHVARDPDARSSSVLAIGDDELRHRAARKRNTIPANFGRVGVIDVIPHMPITGDPDQPACEPRK